MDKSSVIAGVHGALPPHRYTQAEITQKLIDLPANAPHEALIRHLHASSKVASRHLGLPLVVDGAAAVVAVGARRADTIGASGPDVLDSRSHLYPDSLRTMGWDIGASGFQIVLGREVPEVVERYLGDDVTEFLAAHHLSID